MPGIRKNVSDTVRDITRKALSGGKVDQAALRRVTGELRSNLKQFERQLAKDLRAATRAGKDAASQGFNATLASSASQGINATLASSAMAARAASGLLAGIADSLAAQKPHRKR
jgi:hypothetical protein